MFCLYWNVWVFLCHLYSGSVVEATTLDGNNELFARWKRFKLRISQECTVFADTVSLLDSIPVMHFAVCTTLCSSFVSPAEQLAYHTVAWVISIYSRRTSARASFDVFKIRSFSLHHLVGYSPTSLYAHAHYTWALFSMLFLHECFLFNIHTYWRAT